MRGALLNTMHRLHTHSVLVSFCAGALLLALGEIAPAAPCEHVLFLTIDGLRNAGHHRDKLYACAVYGSDPGLRVAKRNT